MYRLTFFNRDLYAELTDFCRDDTVCPEMHLDPVLSGIVKRDVIEMGAIKICV